MVFPFPALPIFKVVAAAVATIPLTLLVTALEEEVVWLKVIALFRALIVVAAPATVMPVSALEVTPVPEVV